MKKNEKKILFGLYHAAKKPEKTVVCSAPELNWLVANPLKKAVQWVTGKGSYRSIGEKEREGEDIIDRKTRLEDKMDGHLFSLEEKGFINYRKTDYLYRINLREGGIERITSMETPKGRLLLWLQDSVIFFIYLGVVAVLVLAGLLFYLCV